MFRPDLTREEVEELKLKLKLFLSDMQVRILEYRLLDYSITQMAMLENCSESKITKELRKIKTKITKNEP